MLRREQASPLNYNVQAAVSTLRRIATPTDHEKRRLDDNKTHLLSYFLVSLMIVSRFAPMSIMMNMYLTLVSLKVASVCNPFSAPYTKAAVKKLLTDICYNKPYIPDSDTCKKLLESQCSAFEQRYFRRWIYLGLLAMTLFYLANTLYKRKQLALALAVNQSYLAILNTDEITLVQQALTERQVPFTNQSTVYEILDGLENPLPRQNQWGHSLRSTVNHYMRLFYFVPAVKHQRVANVEAASNVVVAMA